MKIRDKSKLFASCNHLVSILSGYYNFYNKEPIDDYLISSPSNDLLANCGQTLFEENAESNELFIGIQFGNYIIDEIENNEFISLNSLAVISEEISHFKIIIDTVVLNSNISKLEIEMLGEIDRFICLMHWNQLKIHPKLTNNWKNLHDICDLVFQGDRFINEDNIYREAEGLAFKHLKSAFTNNWDSSYFDFSKIDTQAKDYLSKLREKLLKIKF
ncbi:hypothetical protein QEJ31_11280 [Pigmentibacter sp. JX0631]|uniref:hypothetical protein n=1 Tax=Pigmentibacter sp. JX0631 TaxID=2976982 RepID=UPI0024688F5D|nr:hypothetical protein [Pigmentibacter sp. JX0631]WGL59102.1 hypothetical protein QEJ31_11280 [Pigmentibacter sp. JX0631]